MQEAIYTQFAQVVALELVGTVVREVVQVDVVEVVIALALATVQVNVLLLVRENALDHVAKAVQDVLIDDLSHRVA